MYGGLSGRLDQTAHTLHALYKLRKEREWAWIVSEESLTCVLDAVSTRWTRSRNPSIRAWLEWTVQACSAIPR